MVDVEKLERETKKTQQAKQLWLDARAAHGDEHRITVGFLFTAVQLEQDYFKLVTGMTEGLMAVFKAAQEWAHEERKLNDSGVMSSREHDEASAALLAAVEEYRA